MRENSRQVCTDGHRIIFPQGFSIAFQRTLRIPDDDKIYPLPPGLGNFPIRKIDPADERVPSAMRARGGFIISMYQREALWVLFSGESRAVQIAVGGVNAISGDPLDTGLKASPQNYLVGPDQPWLDGINAGEGFIRQFVAMPLGEGYSVEEQLTGVAEFGGMQIRVIQPKPGVELKRPRDEMVVCSPAPPMGFGAGGKMKQQIDQDPYGIDVWDLTNATEEFVHIVTSEQWTAITGEPTPPTPIDARVYTEYGFPWFDLYREGTPFVGPSDKLAGVKSVKSVDAEKVVPKQPGDQTVAIPSSQVIELGGKHWPKD